MTELQRYLAEEVAEDLVDGIITRREAMRRLGVLGLTAAAASSLLAAPASARPGAAVAAPRTGRHGNGVVSSWAPVATESISFPGPRGTLLGAWAAAERSRGGVLVIHENRGLTDHIKTVAGRFAASGYSALALDLLSEEGGTDALPDDTARMAALNEAALTPERFDTDMQAAVTELLNRLPGQRAGAIGFCFGGGMIWRLLASGENRLAAAAPFYGPFPEGGDLGKAKAAVLAIYGGLDARVGATRPAAQAAMTKAGLDNHVMVFGGADHAFFNDTGPRFNPPAAAEAYRRVLDWFGRNAG